MVRGDIKPARIKGCAFPRFLKPPRQRQAGSIIPLTKRRHLQGQQWCPRSCKWLRLDGHGQFEQCQLLLALVGGLCIRQRLHSWLLRPLRASLVRGRWTTGFLLFDSLVLILRASPRSPEPTNVVSGFPIRCSCFLAIRQASCDSPQVSQKSPLA